ncbi:hypothetical protein TNCV_3232501 [Trichonephila clavipes]|nr:hypothetical protein TNCV_3232501 [Trichonephila clavipes]
MSACGREFHIACMRSKSSSFEAAGRGSRARCRPTKSLTCSIGDTSSERSRRWFAVRGSCIKASLHANYGAAAVDELTKPTLVHMQQQMNVLSITWRKLYGHPPPCGAGIDRRALTLPFVIPCQLFELFSARQSTAFKLASRWNGSTANELLLCGRKIPFLEGR